MVAQLLAADKLVTLANKTLNKFGLVAIIGKMRTTTKQKHWAKVKVKVKAKAKVTAKPKPKAKTKAKKKAKATAKPKGSTDAEIF